jgi:hypothetical protein
MENKQAINIEQAPEPRHIEFHVSFLDTHSGRIEHEVFSDRAAAERFANAQLKEEEAWAVVDVVATGHHREQVQQLVA